MSKVWCEFESIETLNTLVGQRLQFYITSFTGYVKENVDVGRGQHRFCLFRPLHNAYAVRIEVFAETGIEELFRAGHAVKVKMDNVDRAAADRDRVRFGKGIRRTLDVPGMSGGMQQRAGEGGFSRPEVSMQIDRKTGRERARQRSAERRGTGFIIQVGLKMLHLVKWLYSCQLHRCSNRPSNLHVHPR